MKAQDIRNKVLAEATEIVEVLAKAAKLKTPNAALSDNQLNALKLMWPTLHQIAVTASDPVPAVWKGKDTQAKVDAVLSKVSRGTITPEEGKRLLAVVSLGVDIVELPKLLEKLEGTIE
ncbi:hypothetical protein ACFL17_04290 [Pseudomonadota bacterium]